MRPENADEVRRMFEVQAEDFEIASLKMADDAWLRKCIAIASPAAGDSMLEVAAGTCAVGRAFAPHVGTVVCFDASEDMLRVGRREARAAGLSNMVFVKGFGEDLPFLDDGFDLVISRLAFHHIPDYEVVFREMARVLAPGGRLVLVDMEAGEESLRPVREEVEVLRDPSHAKTLSQAEMEALFEENGLAIEARDLALVEKPVGDWLDLTGTSPELKADIMARMEAELAGGPKTGSEPYRNEKGLCYDQHWILTLGRKPIDWRPRKAS